MRKHEALDSLYIPHIPRDVWRRACESLQNESQRKTDMNQDTDQFVKDLIRNNIEVYKRLRDR